MNKRDKLENLKKDEIEFFSEWKYGEKIFPEWENFLTLDYWKDWRNKISNFQTERELVFYASRLGQITSAIYEWKKEGRNNPRGLFRYHYSREIHDVMWGMDPDEMIKQEELRLQNISQVDWRKQYKWAFSRPGINKLSIEEMLDDSWFSEQINNLFDLKNGKLPKNKEEEREDFDTGMFQKDEKNGKLTIFVKEVKFKKFYKKKIDQYQAGIDYDTNEEKIISVHNVYNIFSEQLIKDIILASKMDINLGVSSIKIIVKKYADYVREEGDKWHEEIDEKYFKNETEEEINETFKYEGWTKEQLTKEIERLNTLIDKVRNKDESLTQTQRENSDLVIQNLEKYLNQARITLNKVVDLSNSDTNYQNWSREKLVSAISLLKAENEELKNNQNLFLVSSDSERKKMLQNNQQKLEQFQNILNSLDNNNNNNNNPLPIIPIVSIVGIVVFLASLVAYKRVIRKKRF
jgi:hypothetical protein